MRLRAALAASALVLALAGCSAPAEPDPIVVSLGELEGATVTVPLGGSIAVDTGTVDLETVLAKVDDPAVVDFREGTFTGEMGYFPLFTPLAVGQTAVTLTAVDGSMQPVAFTIVVTAET